MSSIPKLRGTPRERRIQAIWRGIVEYANADFTLEQGAVEGLQRLVLACVNRLGAGGVDDLSDVADVSDCMEIRGMTLDESIKSLVFQRPRFADAHDRQLARGVGLCLFSRPIRPLRPEDNSMAELIFGRIRGGSGSETLVFLPAQRAHELAAVHFAIATAATWRQFAQIVPAADWQDVLEGFKAFEFPPRLDDEFEQSMLPGFEDGDWPDWPEQHMMGWLPADIWRKFGVVHQSVINGPFLSIDPRLKVDIVKALEGAGSSCKRYDALALRACGRGDSLRPFVVETVR